MPQHELRQRVERGRAENNQLKDQINELHNAAQIDKAEIERLQKQFDLVRDAYEILKGQNHSLTVNEELKTHNCSFTEQVQALTKKIESVRAKIKADFAKLFQ